jgi:hypothetical protein
MKRKMLEAVRSINKVHTAIFEGGEVIDASDVMNMACRRQVYVNKFRMVNRAAPKMEIYRISLNLRKSWPMKEPAKSSNK